jgi:enterobactin synthetase component F
VYDRATDAGLRFYPDANPALYSVAQLEKHRGRLTRLIEQVIAHPDTQLRQLDTLSDAERHRLLVTWNGAAAKLTDTSLPAFVAQWAAATPNATGARAALSYGLLLRDADVNAPGFESISDCY